MTINGNEITLLVLLILALSIAIDLIFGELPTRIHPVVFIGKLIDFFSNNLLTFNNKLIGMVLTISVSIVYLAILLSVLVLASFNIAIFAIIASIILSSTFSIKMLLSSAKQIKKDLETGIDIARKSMSYLVSRDTSNLSEKLIISATIETLSENITDSVIAPLFYYIVANIAIITIIKFLVAFNTIFLENIIPIGQISIQTDIFIVIIAISITSFYRIINTLDAMVGYKNEKYMNIGYFPAKLDDILNYIPARFGGIIVVLASMFYKKSKMNWKNSLKVMKKDARKPPSPNSGFTMASVAGALGICLVKKEVYIIGEANRELNKEDIIRTIKLSKLAITLFILFLIILFLFSYIIIFLI